MSVIKKDNVYPLVIPTTLYHDRFGNMNSFVEMNPSIFINEDGTFIILVRTVNYLKYQNKSFTIYGDSSRTIYNIIRGQIKDNNFDLDYCDVKRLEVRYNIPTGWSLWYGVEDIRFINNNEVLACIPECNNSSPCIFKGILRDNILTSFEKCSPNQVEKNWMPYTLSDKHKVIYSVSPFIIKSVLTDDREEIILSEETKNALKNWHGSSNGIDLFGEKLFLIHSNEDIVYNRWLLFNPETKTVKYSKKFVFLKHSYSEFTCSLAIYNNKIFVGLGINDNKAYIIELNQTEISNLFQ
jgi:hypothetical protein